MPHVLRKACVSPDVNSVPPSDDRVSGTPLSANRDLRHAIVAGIRADLELAGTCRQLPMWPQ